MVMSPKLAFFVTMGSIKVQMYIDLYEIATSQSAYSKQSVICRANLERIDEGKTNISIIWKDITTKRERVINSYSSILFFFGRGNIHSVS